MSSMGRSSVRCAGGGSGAREVWESTCADQETECGRGVWIQWNGNSGMVE